MGKRLIVAIAAAAALMIVPGIASAGQSEANFGSHVSQHAQAHGFNGTHNPGMHQGASGWMPGGHHS